jgi:NAD(P)-dependent dehydrogenase (short-subunit alcohol dehydrogenase family)
MEAWLVLIMRKPGSIKDGFRLLMRESSSKSALHGLIHWLAGAYAKTGVTVNGVAPALIQETTMLPGSNEELAKSMLHSFIHVVLG